MELCDACYWCYVAPDGGAAVAHFTRTTYPPSAPAHVCDLTPGSPRTAQNSELLARAIATDDWAPLLQRAADNAQFPPCPRDTKVAGGGAYRWYGNNDFTACAECWAAVMRGSSLAGGLPYKDATDASPRMCEMYSDRMRAHWAHACETGSLDELSAVSRERRGHYNPIHQAINSLMALAAARGIIATTMTARSALLQGANAMVAAASVGTKQYGDSSLPLKYAPMGVQSALLSQQVGASSLMTAGMADPQIQLLLHLY